MKMPEAPVVLAGDVFLVTPTSDYDTKSPTGAKVAVLVDGGATEFKLTVDEYAKVQPRVGEPIAVLVRPTPYSVDGNSGVSFKYLRHVDPLDLDRIGSLLPQSASAK